MSVPEFTRQALKAEIDWKIDKLSLEEQEEKFWKQAHFSPPLYGADMLGTLFDESTQCWNPQDLGTILNLVGLPLAGITQPYLYFGMWKAMFGWHTEDMDLCSINYLHYGKPKHWYCLPASCSSRFESVVAGLFPEQFKRCKMFLRHKTTVIKPSLLVHQFKLPIHSCIQNAGEFILTFPNAYHAGFNHGLNCAESVNFATKEWIPYGIGAKPCTCTSGNASIDMDVFVARHDLFEELGAEIEPSDEMIWDRMKLNGVDIEAKLIKFGIVDEDYPVITLKRKRMENPQQDHPNKKGRDLLQRVPNKSILVQKSLCGDSMVNVYYRSLKS